MPQQWVIKDERKSYLHIIAHMISFLKNFYSGGGIHVHTFDQIYDNCIIHAYLLILSGYAYVESP